MVVLAVLILLRAAPLGAQSASPYVPIDHWAMPFVEHLITAGVIVDPTPLTRPLRQRDLADALGAADTSKLSPSLRATVRRLLHEWGAATPQAYFHAEMSAGAAAATHTVRDPLSLDRGVAPARLDERGFGSVGLDVKLVFGPVVAVSHPVVDTRLEHDPEWYGTTDNATRFSEAYVSGQWRWGELFFGILDRSWGPSGVDGVLLSSNPYSMDHFAATFGTRRVQLQSVATQLDTRATASGDPVNRFMVWDRLWIHPHGRWTLALWGAGVNQGVGRQLEPWLLNPASIIYFRGSSGTVNSFLGVDFERRGGTTLFGQVMLDDIQVSNGDPSGLEPASYALTIGAAGRVGTRPVTWTAFYTQVANLSYRTTTPAESPLYFNLGTGRNFADYDQATLKASVLVHPMLLIEPEATLLRQGEGDPRLPYPAIADFPTTAVLLQGVVQRTIRLALGGRWQRGGLSLTGNGGVHFLDNFDHVSGSSKTEWVGSVSLTIRLHHEGPLP